MIRGRSLSAALLLSSMTSTATSEDRRAITDALSQYADHWDAKDAERFAALFSEDAVMEVHVDGTLLEGSRVVGRPAILAYAKAAHAGRLADRQSRHHFSNTIFLECDAEHAVTDTTAFITHQTATDPEPVLVTSGTYRNTWRKTYEGWRLSVRILSVDRPRRD